MLWWWALSCWGGERAKTSADDTPSQSPADTEAVGPPDQGAYGFLHVAGLLPTPIDLAELPDGSLLVASHESSLIRVDPATGETGVPVPVEHGGTYAPTLKAIAVDPGATGDEALAFALTSTVDGGVANQLLRLELEVDPLAIRSWETLLVVYAGPDLDSPDNDGDLLVARDGDGLLLYVSLGAGDQGSYTATGQDHSDQLASLLAFRTDGDGRNLQEASPSEFDGDGVVAVGLRQPWRIAWCGEAICIADVGEDTYEELNVYAEVGQNFGWPIKEGEVMNPYVDPVHGYGYLDGVFAEDDPLATSSDRNAIVLGTRSTLGGPDGRLKGYLLYADFYEGWVRGLALDDSGSPTGHDVHLAHAAYVTSMLEASDGTLYATDYGGNLRKLVDVDQLPSHGVPGDALSLTSYRQRGYEFEVRYPLWTSGADKDRFVQLPEGARIEDADGELWSWPVGTVAWKTFSWQGTNVETRVLEKTEAGWAAGVYVWEAGDAFLTDGRATYVDLDDGTRYRVPSLSDCETCHAPAYDMLLGPRAFQLGDEGLAVFREVLTDGSYTAPDALGDETTQAARGYLDGNCAFCHNPTGLVANSLNLRFDATLEEMNALDAEHELDDYQELPILMAGRPDRSALVQVLVDTVMPPIPYETADEDGIATLSAWVESL